MNMFSVVVRQAMSGEYYFVICSAKNHKVLVTSEMYKTKRNCMKTADLFCSALAVEIEYEDKIKKACK